MQGFIYGLGVGVVGASVAWFKWGASWLSKTKAGLAKLQAAADAAKAKLG